MVAWTEYSGNYRNEAKSRTAPPFPPAAGWPRKSIRDAKYAHKSQRYISEGREKRRRAGRARPLQRNGKEKGPELWFGAFVILSGKTGLPIKPRSRCSFPPREAFDPRAGGARFRNG